MVENFELSLNVDKNDLKFRIRERVKQCNVPTCWELKDPSDDWFYLTRFETGNGKGRYVQLRRLLFYLEYGFEPRRRVIKMLCDNKACLNPAHMTAKGISSDLIYEHVLDQISRSPCILTWAQAQKWHKDTGVKA